MKKLNKPVVRNNMFETIYTIGCFDHFHDGHKSILKKMESLCEKLVVGIHDDKSLLTLDKKYQRYHEGVDIRKKNVEIFLAQTSSEVIILSDPDEFLNFHNKNISCFARANDNMYFPGYNLLKQYGIPILLLPYTSSVSATQTRFSMHMLKKPIATA